MTNLLIKFPSDLNTSKLRIRMILCVFSFLTAPSWVQAQMTGDPWKDLCVDQQSQLRDSRKRIDQSRARIRKEALLTSLKPVAKGGCGVWVDPATVKDYVSLYGAEEGLLYTVRSSIQMGNSAAEKTECYAKLTEKLVIQEVRKKIPDFSIEKVRRKFEYYKKQLMAVLEDRAGAEPRQSELYRMMSAEVEKASLVTADGFSAFLSKNDPYGKVNYVPLSNSDFGFCENDFMKRNAISWTSGNYPDEKNLDRTLYTGINAVVACPGLWLQLIESSKYIQEDALIHTFSHEMGHFIHSIRNLVDNHYYEQTSSGEWVPMKLNTVPLYAGFMECLNQNYKTLYPPLKKGAKDEKLLAFIQSAMGREPEDMDFRGVELSADYWGDQVMARVLGKPGFKQSYRELLMRENYERLCLMSSDTKLFTGFFGIHPSGQARIEMSFGRPEIQKALGMSDPLPVKTPPSCEL